MKMRVIIGICIVALLLAAGVWCTYALTYSDQMLADQGRCHQSIRIKAINTTRHLFGRKTGADIDADSLKQYSDPLQVPARFACPVQ